MANVFQIGNASRGFTRMDNELLDALAAVALSPAEFKTLHAIARLTLGYSRAEFRITANDVAKRTHILPAHVSRAISRLLARRIIYRVGGSRGDIGICSPKEWIYEEPKTARSNQPKPVETTNVGNSDNDPKLPIPNVSLLYIKKEVNLPTEDITSPLPPVEKPAPKRKPRNKAKAAPAPDRHGAFGLPQMLANNPHAITEQHISDWMKLRKTKRAAISSTVWDALNAELDGCLAAGIDAKTAMTEALLAGWQGFKTEWIVNRLTKEGRMPNQQAARDDDYTGWADALGGGDEIGV